MRRARSEPVRQLQPRSHVIIRQEGPPDSADGMAGMQELVIGTAHGGDAPAIWFVSRRPSTSSNTAMAGQAGRPAAAGSAARRRSGEVAPPRDGQRVARLYGEPRDLVERRRHDACRPPRADAGTTTTRRSRASRAAPRTGSRVTRAGGLDLDMPSSRACCSSATPLSATRPAAARSPAARAGRDSTARPPRSAHAHCAGKCSGTS